MTIYTPSQRIPLTPTRTFYSAASNKLYTVILTTLILATSLTLKTRLSLSAAFNKLSTLTVVLWSVYPAVWILAEVIAVICVVFLLQ